MMDEMREFSFEKLIVYQKAKEYVKVVYSLLHKFPSEERFAMCDQLRRASVSVISNIAEGTSRQTSKDKCHFLDIAYGSLMETYSQLDLARDLEYITDHDINDIKLRGIELLRLLASLKRSYLA
jgi:four helix bundle protein